MKKRLIWCFVMLQFASCLNIARHYEKPPQPLEHRYISKTEQQLRRYIKDDYISECISKSKYPYLIAAIGKVESDYRPQITGDNGKSRGLFQIQQRYWGHVPDSIEGQVRKCETILQELIDTYGYQTAIVRYNGSGKMALRYARRVQAIEREIRNAKT